MNILITRPDERGQQLLAMLAEQGIFALHQPMLKIEAGQALPQLPHLLSRLKSGDYVFTVSKTAVDFAVKAVKETGFKWRADLRYFAVGQGSANYFCSYIEQPVYYPIESENSEGLLALPQMQNLTGKKIVILRANSGREYFSEQAHLRGAEIVAVECYQRQLWSDDLSERLSIAKRAGIDTILVTSGEILNILLEQIAIDDREWLLQCHLLVVGKRIARLAERAGWQKKLITISEKADNHSLLELVLKNVKF